MHLPWRIIDGISTSLTARETAKLRDLAEGGVVLEIGSAYGYSAIQCAEAGARWVLAVDPHAGENLGSYETMRENVSARRVEDRVTIWRTTSRKAFECLPDGMFDLVFVDGDHSEDAVAHDIREAWRVLKPGGWLACHDRGEDSCPGVQRAIDAWHVPLVPQPPPEQADTLWIVRKG